MQRFWAALLLLALVLGRSLPATADAAVTSHVDTSQGFARLVFDMPDTPKAEAEVNFGVLVIKFLQPVTLDTEAIRIGLGAYASLVRQDVDRTTVRIALRGPVRLAKTIAGRQVAIDLMPPRFTGDPPPFNGVVEAPSGGTPVALVAPRLSEAAERAQIASFAVPAPLDLLPIQIGVQPTFTRLVFDWRVPVEYTVEQNGSEVVARFSRAARVDLARLRTDPPRYLKSADADTGNGKLVVILRVEPGLDVQHFRDGNKVSIDLSPKAPTETAHTADAHDDDASALRGLPEPMKTAELGAVAVEPHGPPSAPVTLHRPMSDAVAAIAGVAAETELPRAAPQAPAPSPDDLHTGEKPPLAPEAVGRLQIAGDGTGLTLTTSWPSPVAAAAFRRGDTLWLVYDTTDPLIVDEPGREAAPVLGAIATSVEDGAQVVRVELKTDALLEAISQGNTWRFRLADAITVPVETVAVTREVPPSGRPRLRVKGEVAKIHWLRDPAMGDFVLVATALAPARSVPLERRFVELSALATAQGVAITPFTEDLSARLAEGDLVIDAQGGLAITASNTVERGSSRSPVERVAEPGFLDFAAWRGDGPSSLIEMRKRGERAIVAADDKNRNMRRLDLARFYVANGFDAEALGTLALMIKEDPRVDNAPAYHALRGAALLMLGRARDAEQVLAHGSLVSDPDIGVWRGAAAAEAGHADAAAEAFAAAEAKIVRYTPDWQARFRLAMADAALARRDTTTAARALNAVPPDGLDSGRRAQFDLLTGRLLDAQGRGAEALGRFERAAEGPRGRAAARARLEATNLAVRLGKMSESRAIEALEQLRYDWRGDTLELATLTELGKHYIADRRYRDGLSILHAAASYFPKDAAVMVADDAMRTTFRGLFLEGGADALPPIEALALFYDFRELTPLGSEGDDMIRRLADRLMVIDLLPQAAELLQHQVDNRLQGAARAQVASRLALIYLMDHKPEEALRTIRATRQAQLPDGLDNERRLLEARALTELKQFDFALEVLLHDQSVEAERIRAEVYWGAGNWSAAAEHIEQVLADRWRDPKPLESAERLDIMRAAISYLFGKDDFGLASLRDRYGIAMKATSDGPAFDLVTAKPDVSSPDVGELAKKIASADTLNAFMAAFRANQAATN